MIQKRTALSLATRNCRRTYFRESACQHTLSYPLMDQLVLATNPMPQRSVPNFVEFLNEGLRNFEQQNTPNSGSR